MDMMTVRSQIKKAVKIVGTQSLLAKQCGVSQAAVSKWVLGTRKVHPKSVPLITIATDGQVKEYQIRPDLPHLFPPPNPQKTKPGTHTLGGNNE